MGSGFSLYTSSPDPLREALLAICGKEPPDFVRGHGISGLSDQQVSALQDWCSLNARPEWATGLGVLEAAELIVSQAVDNANIAPDPVPGVIPGPVPEAGSHCSDCGRPRSPVDRCSAESVDDDGECPYLTIERLRAELARVSSAAAPVPGDMTTTKREFVAAGDYVPLKTKFGPIMVLPTDGEHFNVEVRDHDFVIDGVHFCFALTVRVGSGLAAAPVGRLTEWSSGGTLTQRRKDLLLLEVLKCVADAARGPMASALMEAQKRVVNNNIRSVDQDIEEAQRKLADLVAVRASLLDEETSLSAQDAAV
jgi:hypothetical protein